MTTALFIDAAEAARRTGLGVAYLKALLARGEIPSLKAGRRRLISVAALEKWAADHESGEIAGVRA